MITQIKVAIAAVLLSAFGVLYWMYDSAVSDNELLTIENEQITARTERDAVKIKEITLVAEQNSELYLQASKKVQDNLDQLKVLESTVAEQKESYNELVKKFADHDFENLVTKKQVLMQRRMRSATERLFREFEKATGRATDNIPRPDS